MVIDNSNLYKAAKAKKDEFFTQHLVIEKEEFMRVPVPQWLMDLLSLGFLVFLLLVALAIAIWGEGIARILGVIFTILFGYGIYLFTSAVVKINREKRQWRNGKY